MRKKIVFESIFLLLILISLSSQSNYYSDAFIDKVFLAQTHVAEPDSPYFKLIAGRDVLLKVNLTAYSKNIRAPIVQALVKSPGGEKTFTLKGPEIVPVNVSALYHSFDNSYTVTIPAGLVKPGLSIKITAGRAFKELSNIAVGADHFLPIRCFDFRVFGDLTSPLRKTEEVWAEYEAKLPVTGISVDYVGVFDLPAIVIAPYENKPSRLAISDPPSNWHSWTFSFRTLRALARANGEEHIALYIASMSTAGGGWGGGFNFAGIQSDGVFWHELGHALGLSHANNDPNFPYTGDNVTQFDFNAGPVWAYDPINNYFIPSTIQENSVGDLEHKGWYKRDPQWGGGTGDQERGYYLRHYSDYNTFLMQKTMDNFIARKDQKGNYLNWDDEQKTWVPAKTNYLWSFPVIENIPVYTLWGSLSVTPEANYIYEPMAYTGNLVIWIDPRNPGEVKYVKDNRYYSPLNISVKVIQGGKTNYYALNNGFNINADPNYYGEIEYWALNVPQSRGEVTEIDVFYTPDLLNQGFPQKPKRLSYWRAGENKIPMGVSIGDRVWNDLNRNGLQDPGEPGLEGVVLMLWRDADGDGEAEKYTKSTVTIKDGIYRFAGVEAGAYQVSVVHHLNYGEKGVLRGMISSQGHSDPDSRKENDDKGIDIKDDAGKGATYVSELFEIRDDGKIYYGTNPQANMTVDFGFYTFSPSIGGRVWLDRNADGVENSGEQGISGVKLILWKDINGDGLGDGQGGFIGGTNTDKDGYYRFDNLSPGTYQVFVWEVANFDQGGPLYQMVNSQGAGNPDDRKKGDDDGIEGGGSYGGPGGSYITKSITIRPGKILSNGDLPEQNLSIGFGFYKK